MALLALVISSGFFPVHASWIAPFISELHYDNAGGDADEFVAVTGQSGQDLSGWQLVLYNGGDGRPYRSVTLSGVLDTRVDSWVEAAWPIAGIQNGPDAVALISASDAVVDFIAYEAAVTATEGSAAGMTARLLPVAEGADTAVGRSLQRIDAVDAAAWVAAAATPGILNAGLRGSEVRELPVAGAGLLWLAGFAGWLLTVYGRRLRPRLA
jgi:hypothetical protein